MPALRRAGSALPPFCRRPLRPGTRLRREGLPAGRSRRRGLRARRFWPLRERDPVPRWGRRDAPLHEGGRRGPTVRRPLSQPVRPGRRVRRRRLRRGAGGGRGVHGCRCSLRRGDGLRAGGGEREGVPSPPNARCAVQRSLRLRARPRVPGRVRSAALLGRGVRPGEAHRRLRAGLHLRGWSLPRAARRGAVRERSMHGGSALHPRPVRAPSRPRRGLLADRGQDAVSRRQRVRGRGVPGAGQPRRALPQGTRRAALRCRAAVRRGRRSLRAVSRDARSGCRAPCPQ